jgi:hypothetical protein
LPARIHLLPLPPYSPELNPVEGLWDQTQDVTGNRRFADLDQLEEALTRALRPFWETPARALSLVHHWLHTQANAIASLILPVVNEKWYEIATPYPTRIRSWPFCDKFLRASIHRLNSHPPYLPTPCR